MTTSDKPDMSRASRELDAYIHSHILGLEIEYYSIVPSVKGDGTFVGALKCPWYSSDRSAAFELAWWFHRKSIEVIDGHCWVKLNVHMESEAQADGPVDEFCLLVCQAALRAKGIDTGGGE